MNLLSLFYYCFEYFFLLVSGWRLGWMVIPTYLIDSINTLQQNMFINAPTISQTAALQCWEDDTIDILEQHVQKYKQSRTIILTALETLKEDIPKSNIAQIGRAHV